MSIETVKKLFNELSYEEKTTFLKEVSAEIAPCLKDTEAYKKIIKERAIILRDILDYDSNDNTTIDENRYCECLKRAFELEELFRSTYDVSSAEYEVWETLSRFNFYYTADIANKLGYTRANKQIDVDALIEDAIEIMQHLVYDGYYNSQIGRLQGFYHCYTEEERPHYYKLVYGIESADNSF